MKCLARIKFEHEQTFPYVRRCYYFIFIPTSFWPRLSTRLIGDTQLQKELTKILFC
ncbi:unnamed protein product [Rotaria sp. Silwood2]|nr:unnamed protein product [Rotaria sp. Silwood2]CAF3350295.1 unnamed protein product [Rotaria sp. Silwood2]CAF4217220.1 unnamed protein product [Rotaria sp. Silwood2]CAF4614538.1 unnamed protein product [Rotaria sp. Silwood2]